MASAALKGSVQQFLLVFILTVDKSVKKSFSLSEKSMPAQ